VKKAKETWGVDPVESTIVRARQKFPQIRFEHGRLESLPFPNGFFDVVILTDVLEHVTDEIAALNEIHRVTKAGSTVIITTPHTGIFAWLDPYNYGGALRTRLPRAYRYLRRLGLAQSVEQDPPKHRHYSRQQLEALLKRSKFGSGFVVDNVFRSGCFVYPLYINLFEALVRLLPEERVETVTTPARWLSEMDYRIPYGSAAYNIAVRLKRT
jgi:SAM-dependent methyltransferase